MFHERNPVFNVVNQVHAEPRGAAAIARGCLTRSAEGTHNEHENSDLQCICADLLKMDLTTRSLLN